ncbi:MAG: M43 family zinc metalloprotease [Bacteroidia bacterium]
MKLKFLLFSAFFALFSAVSFSQIDGHHCGFDDIYDKMKQNNPEEWQEYLDAHGSILEATKKMIAEQKLSGAKKSAATYTIPVVFHVLHNGGPENISYAQIESAIDRLNECFNGYNPELSTIQSVFTPLTVNMGVEFKLAKRAPNGACFNGVTRTKSEETESGDESAQLNAIKTGNDVYQGEWPTDEYLNIFVVKTLASAGAAAYAYFPQSTSMRYGVWSQHTYIGDTGTSNAGRSGTVVHELGHWFALYHPWGTKNLAGSNNNPSPSDCGNTDNNDYVDDTPKTIGNKTCDLDANTCDEDDPYWDSRSFPTPMIDNVENFMDYSYCFKMFTIGQGDRMTAALNSSTGGRNNLWKAANLTATGVDDPEILCKAEFDANKYEICAGESISFTDMSYFSITGWNWTFTGADVASSGDQNPTITYSTPGVYDVTLEVTDGSTSQSKTRTAMIRVLPNPGNTVNFTESFETSNVPDINWTVSEDYESDYNESTAAYVTGSKSLRITNSGSRAGNVYNLISTTYNMSSFEKPVINFYYAFAKRSDSNTDILKVYVSKDCGITWTLRKSISTSSIATAPNTTSTFVPTSDQWAFIEMTNLTSDFATESFRVKFEFTSGGGNYFYLEDINIIGEGTAAVGIDEYQGANVLSYYPNPTEGNSINLYVELQNSSNVKVNIYDLVGRKLQIIDLGLLSTGKIELPINTSNLSSGTYLFETILNGVPSKMDKIIVE